MLKVEHPTDYLKKEGVNSEITGPIEEEQPSQETKIHLKALETFR